MGEKKDIDWLGQLLCSEVWLYMIGCILLWQRNEEKYNVYKKLDNIRNASHILLSIFFNKLFIIKILLKLVILFCTKIGDL